MMSTDIPEKICFVTVGATASFNALVSEVLSTDFLVALRLNQYTKLLIQYGQHGRSCFDQFMKENEAILKPRYGLEVAGFDFNIEGLTNEMLSTRASPQKNRVEGLVISHAGNSLRENKSPVAYSNVILIISF